MDIMHSKIVFLSLSLSLSFYSRSANSRRVMDGDTAHLSPQMLSRDTQAKKRAERKRDTHSCVTHCRTYACLFCYFNFTYFFFVCQPGALPLPSLYIDLYWYAVYVFFFAYEILSLI